MNRNYTALINRFNKSRLKLSESMSLHTTNKIGGPADLYFEAYSKEDLIKAIRTAIDEKIPFFILGAGSNILVSDKGYRGLIIRNKATSIRIAALKGKYTPEKKDIKEVLVEAESGALINQLVRFTLDEGLSGLEYFLGQPGTIGGSVWINSHNMRLKKFLGDLIQQAQIINLKGELVKVDQKYFNFGYDYSHIQKTGDIILSVVFVLIPENKDVLWKRAHEELNYRQEKQPNSPSTGCTFKNISRADALRLATPNHTTSAGFLIDQAGLKGARSGGAQISDKHANFIINMGDAKALDMIQLIKLCKEKVREKFGVELKEEIVYLGEF